ncbi:MAG: LPS-assembly protein LptD, partial [Xanthomonadales bacterium]|nr:LPS assembly protein LptD [Gammaproteobacteria bacterium]NNL95308.1 LPS-assembly protein LptD [Xanthomonadales bacterium]
MNLKTVHPACLFGTWLIIGTMCSNSLYAEDTPVPAYCPDPAVAPVAPRRADPSGQPIDLWANRFDARNPDYAEASGDVELRRADQVLSSDLMRYLPADKQVEIPGAMIFRDSAIRATADSAHYSFLNDTGNLQGVEYRLAGATANGSAREMELSAGNRSFLRDLRFTTCPGEDPEWELLARELELRHEEGYGIARGARLEFMDIPFLYLPWVTFPIDARRKSGFLYPHFSSANDNGFEMGIPYYWNIAPNQDATLMPRYFTDRGFMMTGEYRMLTPRTAGELEFDFLFDDKKTNRNRHHYTVQHHTAINRRWRAAVQVDRVSDPLYFQDFGLSLAQTARQFLHSYAGIDGGGRYWTFSLLADDFQVIDESVSAASEPYRRLPRIYYSLDRPLGNSGLRFGLESEVVSFDRDIGVTGVRTDIYPQLGWGMERYWGFVRGEAGYRYTHYDLDLKGATGNDRPDRGT